LRRSFLIAPSDSISVRVRLTFCSAAFGLLSVFAGDAGYMPWLKTGTGGAILTVITGTVTAFVYWLIAGRRAGAWKGD
jgi:hypothetical protein